MLRHCRAVLCRTAVATDRLVRGNPDCTSRTARQPILATSTHNAPNECHYWHLGWTTSCLQEIQQLPYQHIVKWLPSKMRSRDPGPDECLDIQVETASGKKDLRMRCQSAPAVQTIIADIRQTVQVRSATPCARGHWWCSVCLEHT